MTSQTATSTTVTSNRTANRLIQLARQNALFFHDPQGREYARIEEKGTTPPRIERLRSLGFKSWLAKTYYEETQSTAKAGAVEEALNTLCGFARFDSYERSVNMRVASQNNNLYVDLGTQDRTAVEITPDGWGIINNPPVAFWRPKGMRALMQPAPDGNWDNLFSLLNIYDSPTRLLIIFWILGAFHPEGPYPVLALYGEQGSSKSITTKIIKSLVDPNESLLRSSPRDLHDLAVGAANNHVLALDNVSDIGDWLSDALCRISTGGGYGTRQLYSDDEEIVIDAKRPVMLNGITEIVYRPDLLDRTIVLNLPSIPADTRKSERRIWDEFTQIAPGIMGCIFDTLAGILANFDKVNLPYLPRMADFAEWIAAAGPSLGIPGGDLVDVFILNQKEAEQNLLNDDPLGAAICGYIAVNKTFTGTANDLLNILNVPLASWNYHDSPNARSLSTKLRRLIPAFRKANISVEFSPHPPRTIKITEVKP